MAGHSLECDVPVLTNTDASQINVAGRKEGGVRGGVRRVQVVHCLTSGRELAEETLTQVLPEGSGMLLANPNILIQMKGGHTIPRDRELHQLRDEPIRQGSRAAHRQGGTGCGVTGCGVVGSNADGKSHKESLRERRCMSHMFQMLLTLLLLRMHATI